MPGRHRNFVIVHMTDNQARQHISRILCAPILIPSRIAGIVDSGTRRSHIIPAFASTRLQQVLLAADRPRVIFPRQSATIRYTNAPLVIVARRPTAPGSVLGRASCGFHADRLDVFPVPCASTSGKTGHGTVFAILFCSEVSNGRQDDIRRSD
jgi:hypothetical protein